MAEYLAQKLVVEMVALRVLKTAAYLALMTAGMKVG